MVCPCDLLPCLIRSRPCTVYNAFTRYGKSSSWCKNHALSFRALSRAVSIRSQLKKYMTRFNLPMESCEGDAKRLRQCLVRGYWRNGAKMLPDGTYRPVHGNAVCHPHVALGEAVLTDSWYQVLNVHPNSVFFTRKPKSGWVVYHEIEEAKKTL